MVEDLFDLEPDARVQDVKRLEEIMNKALEMKKRGNTQMVAALTPYHKITGFKQSLVQKGFHIEKEWGNLLLVLKGNEVPFYTLLTKESVVYFITLARKTEDIPATVMNYINSTRDVALIRIGNRRMHTIREQLVKRYPGISLSYFTAHRDPHTSTSAAYRESTQRTIIYSGDDGYDTLEEMEYHYGIIPRIMEFHISENERFRLDVNGIFTIIEGNASGILDIIREVILEVVGFTLRFPTRKKWTSPETILKGKITQKWGRKELEKMEQALSSELGVTTFIPVMNIKRGIYCSRLVDVDDHASWELYLTGCELRLIPKEGAGMRSLLKISGVLEEYLSLLMEENTEVMA